MIIYNMLRSWRKDFMHDQSKLTRQYDGIFFIPLCVALMGRSIRLQFTPIYTQETMSIPSPFTLETPTGIWSSFVSQSIACTCTIFFFFIRNILLCVHGDVGRVLHKCNQHFVRDKWCRSRTVAHHCHLYPGV